MNAIVNYDNFHLGPPAADTFYAMVKHNQERYFLSSTRYSTNAFFRRQLREDFAAADLEQSIYDDFREARSGLRRRAPAPGVPPDATPERVAADAT